MNALLKLPVIPEIYLGDISLTYKGSIMLFSPTAIPQMNLPKTPSQMLGTKKRRQPEIPITSANIKTYRLPISFRIELEERAAIPAAAAIDKLNNP